MSWQTINSYRAQFTPPPSRATVLQWVVDGRLERHQPGGKGGKIYVRQATNREPEEASSRGRPRHQSDEIWHGHHCECCDTINKPKRGPNAYSTPGDIWRCESCAKKDNYRVYFISKPANGLIKIGCTADLATRLGQLQSKYGPLEVLTHVPGYMGVEQQMHEKFGKLRFRNEWFSPAPALLEYIDSVVGSV